MIAAATETELTGLRASLAPITTAVELAYVVTGVGPVATAIALTERLLATAPALLINVGIAGSFSEHLPPGTVVRVARDTLADLGAEDRDGRLLRLSELGLASWDDALTAGGYLEAAGPADMPAAHRALLGIVDRASELPQATGVTLARAHGAASTIRRFRAAFPEAEVESMEGAAAMLAARRRSIPALQIRAISNRVGPRDRAAWLIGPALTNLATALVRLLSATGVAGARAPLPPSR